MENIRRIAASKVTMSIKRPGQMIMFASISKFFLISKTISEKLLTNSPLVSYDSVTSDIHRLAKLKNFTMFDKDLANNALPQWMFITPNMSQFLPE